MKRMFWLLALTLALPVAALASSVDFTNSGGTLTGTSAGFNLSNSILIEVNGLNGMGLVTGNNLGSVTFSTGALVSGSLTQGGTFAGGGSFVITGNGTNGIPNTTIFNGSFSGPVTWSLITSGSQHLYTLSGALSGTWFTGASVVGATIQLTVPVGTGFFNGKTTISSGDTNISVSTPEPGSLSLMGTGLVGLAGMLRRKLRA